MTRKEIEQQKIDRLGTKRIMNCGDKATIISYKNSDCISVEFSDGTIVENKSYYHFVNGEINNQNKNNKFIGMINTMNCGIECKIIRYRNCDNINFRFRKRIL